MSDIFLQNLMSLNNSKVLAGISIILMNVGSRYVISDLGIVHNKILASEAFKKIIVFAMFFVATRDVLVAFMLTIAYIIIVDGILHEKRKFCIVPKKYFANTPPVTEQEYNKAKEIIKLYESNKNTNKSSLENNLNVYDIYKKNLSVLNTNANTPS
jgi:hypothetical protein